MVEVRRQPLLRPANGTETRASKHRSDDGDEDRAVSRRISGNSALNEQSLPIPEHGPRHTVYTAQQRFLTPAPEDELALACALCVGLGELAAYGVWRAVTWGPARAAKPKAARPPAQTLI